MQFSNECHNCQCGQIIEHREELQQRAKQFWVQVGASYIFACGACYNPAAFPGVEIFRYGRYCIKHTPSITPFIPKFLDPL